jgi:hypothetical protein
VFGDWLIGASTDTLALENRVGVPNLTKVGSVNLQTPFMNGYYAASGFSGTAYLDSTIGSTGPISGDSADSTSISVSFWFKDTTGFSGGTVGVLGRWTGNNGWCFLRDSGTNTLYVAHDANLNAMQFSYTVNQWYHVVYVLEEGVDSSLYIDGVLVDTSATPTITDPNTVGLQVGGVNSGGNPFTGGQIAGLNIWRNYKLTQADVSRLYNGGSYQPTGNVPMMEYNVDVAGVTGQKVSIFAKLDRTTSAAQPALTSFGAVLI